MEVAGAAFWAALMVTFVTSKPVCLHVEDDSSKSSESSESMSSSEETEVQFGPSQPALTDTGLQTELLDSNPSSSTTDSAASPVPEDPQTSTDIDPLQPLPQGPCQTALQVDSSLGAAPDSPDAGVAIITTKPKGTGAYEGLQREATPPAPVQVLTPTPLSVSTDTPSTIPEDTPATSLDCFTVQLLTAEPPPPRGDSI
ncbi:flocculation protein FLO11-like [Poecilia formosa]|uniref:flocculation protein FLO11-like n=1 Tax=Poecilia formosa TaxID=48698 RepID=UPI000443B0A9|nr:PREDICTED: flocculation protein FLO11-like [Poecilia formosa]XP_007572887.1 PREDICTED: flocculation protein FLO11-like [Poecilia formosa]